MSDFNDTLARMKSLYTYGMVNENDKKHPVCTLEYTKKAADGKYYGIVKEYNSYYIKQSVEGKQSIAESYEYIGGFMNKNDYKYNSYNNALKHLEFKLSSINEAQEGKVNITTLDPFKKDDLVIEGTDRMKDEIARQRQIMYNASMLMNESIGFSNTGVPEANHTSKASSTTDKNAPFTETAKYEEEHKGSAENPEKQGEPFGDGKAPENGKDVKDANVPSNGTAVAAQHPSGGKVAKVNESEEKDWGSEGIGKGQDPKTVGWDMENQTKVNEGECCPNCGKCGDECKCKQVNEEENDWASEGLPADSQAGVGSPDGHLMEDNEDDVYLDDEEGDEDVVDIDDDDDVYLDDEEEVEDGEGGEDIVDDETIEDEDFVDDGEGEVGDDEEFEEFDENDPDALRNEIERLQAKLAELEGGAEEPIDGEGEEEVEDGGEDIVDDETIEDEDFVDDGEGDGEDDFSEEEEIEDNDDFQFESKKKKKLDTIVESVVRKFMNEDELHVFGDHPGYRKKPMNLPPTGEDKNAHGEDINDDSVHNEEPFGKQIGSSDPFTELVNAVTSDIKYQLKHGLPLDNKKKVD